MADTLSKSGVVDRNQCGRALAITVITPIRRGWVPLIYLGFAPVRRFPIFTNTLRRLSFIHFARWCILRKIPYNGPPQRPERLHAPYFIFESNFNGSWEDYLDSFAYVLPVRIWATWVNSMGFPGPKPTTRFKDYVRHNQYDVEHYYSAYPQATTTMVTSALSLQARFDRFEAQTAELDPDQFAAAYRRLLTAAQREL